MHVICAAVARPAPVGSAYAGPPSRGDVRTASSASAVRSTVTWRSTHITRGSRSGVSSVWASSLGSIRGYSSHSPVLVQRPSRTWAPANTLGWSRQRYAPSALGVVERVDWSGRRKLIAEWKLIWESRGNVKSILRHMVIIFNKLKL